MAKKNDGFDEATEAPATPPEQSPEERVLEQGFRGVEVDPTPNSAYTVPGVLAGEPTPETDDDAAEKARLAAKKVERRAAGVAKR